MKDLALGRYIPYNTWIHRLDPRAKIAAMIILLIGIFLPVTIWEYVVLAFIMMAIVRMAKIRLRTIYQSLKPMWVMFAFLFILNIFFMVDNSPILFTIPWINTAVRVGPIIQTAFIVLRLMIMVMITTVVTTSTKPLDLTYGLEYFMSPLKVVKFPAHEIAMTISIALRFIPTLLEETERIMKAQASRGVDLAEGKLKEKIMAIIALIVPLFISAFQRSEELANAMESRGYHPSAIRTRYRQLHFKVQDAVALFGVAVLTGLLILSTQFPLESFF